MYIYSNSSDVLGNVKNLGNTFSDSFSTLADSVLGTIPQIIVAIILIVIGWFIASLVRKFIEHVFAKFTVIDEALRSVGVDKILEKCNLRLNVGSFCGILLELFIILIFALVALDVLGLSQVAIYLDETVLGYIPNVIAAAVIIAVGALIAEFSGNVVANATRATSLGASGAASVITRTAIWVTTLLVALEQLEVAEDFIKLIFFAIILSISIAVGLAFGLGGVKSASEFIDSIRKELNGK